MPAEGVATKSGGGQTVLTASEENDVTAIAVQQSSCLL
jgi:hypothetical protein